MLVYTANVLTIRPLLWPELFPPIATKWVHPLHISPSFWVLIHCTMTLQLNSWTLVSDLQTIVISHWSKKSKPVPAISQELRTLSSPCSAIRLNHHAPPCMRYFWLHFPVYMANSKYFSNREGGDRNVLTQLYKLTVRMLSWEKFGLRLWRKLNIGLVLSGWVLWLVNCTANDQHA